MAYSEALAQRIRVARQDELGVTERKMFGGLAFMVQSKAWQQKLTWLVIFLCYTS